MFKRSSAALVAALLLALPAVAQSSKWGEFVLIVHVSNPTEELSRQEVARMFLKQRARWDHGERVRPVDLSEAWEVRGDFTSAIFRRTVLDIEEHWKKKVFSGRDVPPPKKASEQEILDYVASHPGAIGYVSSEITLPDDVKLIQVIE